MTHANTTASAQCGDTSDRLYLGLPWDAFVAQWCHGVAPATNTEATWTALDALARLWPQRLEPVLSSRRRGIAYIAAFAHDGNILAECEGRLGFAPVLNRIRKGERSALIEATVAAALIRLGRIPDFEPGLLGKHPDLAIELNNRNVYFEIVAVDRAKLTKEAAALAHRMANLLMDRNKAVSIELYLGPDWIEDDWESVLEVISQSPASPGVVDTACDVHFIKEPAIQGRDSPLVTPRIEVAPEIRAVSVVTSARDQGLWATAMVRRAVSDNRAAFVLSQELHHLSKDETNIVIIDASGVPGGAASWGPLLRRTMQPTRNTRVGAIVILDQGIAGWPPKVRLEWTVMPNPYAANPIPPELIGQLEQLHEPLC